MMIYSIRDLQTSVKEIERIEEICSKNNIDLYINGEETGMFECIEGKNGFFNKIKHCSYISLGFKRISGMTSLFLYIDNRYEYKDNLVSIGAEYYKSSIVDKEIDDSLFTKNKLCLKDYVIGFGHSSSIIKMLFYFENRGIEGFMGFLNGLNAKTDLIFKELENSRKFENLLRFENYILCDKKGFEDNELFYNKFHEKFDSNLPELFGLYEFDGKKRLLFVGTSTGENFSKSFIKNTIDMIE